MYREIRPHANSIWDDNNNNRETLQGRDGRGGGGWYEPSSQETYR